MTTGRVGGVQTGAHRLPGPCREGCVCRCAHVPGGTSMIRSVTAIRTACSTPWEGRPGPSVSSYAGLKRPCLPASRRRRPVLSGTGELATPQPPEALRRKSLFSAGVSKNRPPAQVRACLKACLSSPKRALPRRGRCGREYPAGPTSCPACSCDKAPARPEDSGQPGLAALGATHT